MSNPSSLSNLPDAARTLWISSFNAFNDEGLDEASAAKNAWEGVRRSYTYEEGGWVPRSELVPLNFYITKAAQDAQTGVMRWMAVASDTLEDSYRDEMSQQLFEGFLRRIKANEEVPERWQTDFWKGGTPYLSISHYSGSNGTLPGTVEAVYMDGNRLKAKGTFSDTLIGRAAFQSVRESVKKTKAKTDGFLPVRISIGFLDYKHEHKSNGTVFVRESMDDICLECLREKLGISEKKGLKYLDGPLVHLAMTRVPVNERTSIEVNKSMLTMKEDAASIIGLENAEELDEIERELIEEAKKSRAFVTKSEAENVAQTLALDSISDGKTDSPSAEPKPVPAASEVSAVPLPVPNQADISVVEKAEVTEVVPVHVLDPVLSDLKAVFDGVDKSDPKNAEQLQGAMESLAQTIRSQFGKGTPKSESVDIAKVVEEAVRRATLGLTSEIALLKAKLDKPVFNTNPGVVVQEPVVVEPTPVQRSINVPLLVNDPAQHKSKAPEPKKVSSLTAAVNKSVGLPDDFERSGGTYLTG